MRLGYVNIGIISYVLEILDDEYTHISQILIGC